jgi:F-type H+-transporting ATPase subunit gamma
MSQFIRLRQRIAAIKKTSKITRAMRLMSMSLYLRYERQKVFFSRHRTIIFELLRTLQGCIPSWENPQFFPSDILNINPLIIVITSSKGLCGSFNASLLRYIESDFILEPHQKPAFMTIGVKGREFLQRRNLSDLVYHNDQLNSSNLVEIAQELAALILDKKSKYSSVVVYSNQFRNFFTHTPYKTALIPFPSFDTLIAESSKIEEAGGRIMPHGTSASQKNVPFIWEDDKLVVMDTTATLFLKSTITYLLLDSLLAEYSARFIAMDQSTINAENYLEKLTLQYNKSRQALITAELSELSSSFAP